MAIIYTCLLSSIFCYQKKHAHTNILRKPFIVAPGVDVQAVAAADLGEVQVDAILAHRGSVRERASLEFQVQWSDGDVTWEPWERVKKLVAVEDYIGEQPALKALKGK